MPKKLEILVGTFLTAFLLFTFRSMLFYGTTTVIHDNLYTEITGFHFLAENLLNGNFPLWDPYSFGGQPFAPLLLQLRLLDPINWICVFVGSLFTKDTVILFHWSRVAMMWFSLLGVYACFRPLAKTTISCLSLLAVLFLSSMLYGSFRQPGLLHHFAWVPWTVFFGRRILFEGDQKWRTCLAFAFTVGVAWQCYFFAATWLWLLLLLVGAILFYRENLKLSWQKYAAVTSLILLMMGPNLAVWLQEYDFVYPLRMVATSEKDAEPFHSGLASEGETHHLVSRGIKVPHHVMVHSGFHGTWWDLAQHLIVDKSTKVGNEYTGLRRVYHDAGGFLGILTWVIAIFGLLAAKHAEKKFWVPCLLFWGLLFLGPNAWLHELVIKYYPPASYSRHSGYYLGHFQFVLLYFFVLGMNTLVQRKNVWLPALLLIAQMAVVLSAVPEKIPLALYWCVILGSGLGGLWLARKAPRMGHVVFFSVLVLDLTLELWASALLYAHQPHPKIINRFDTNVRAFAFPNFRKPYPEQKRFPETGQFMRGIPFWERVPSALATPLDGEAKNFTEALREPRNNSYYQLTSLYSLVHSEIPARSLERLLGVGEDIVQFRSGALAIPFSRIEPHLKELGEEKGRQWLARNVILNDGEENVSFPPAKFHYRVTEYRHGKAVMEVSAEGPGFLLWQDGFHHGWLAWLNDEPVEVLRANGVFKGVELPAGNHTLVFRYVPLSFLIALFAYGFATFLIAIVCLLSLLKESFRVWLPAFTPQPQSA